MSKLISVIIPVYNVASYIEECLQSVFQQTYQSLEVLIIDDCGKDNSMQLVKNFIEKIKDVRFKIIQHPKNLGLSAARNTGIKNATGDYLYFLDSDDFISNNCIETFITLIKQHPDSDIVFGSASFYPNQWGNFCLHVNNNIIPEYSNNRKWINNVFFKDDFLPVTAWNKLVKTEFINKNRLFFKEGVFYEDELWYFLIANFCHKISFNKQYTYFYRNTPTGIISNYGSKHMDSEIIIIKECLKHINYRYFFPQIIHIIHLAHTAYCRRYGSSESIYIRYPKAFIFFIKSIFMIPENLRK